jgi:hypothetical protein
VCVAALTVLQATIAAVLVSIDPSQLCYHAPSLRTPPTGLLQVVEPLQHTTLELSLSLMHWPSDPMHYEATYVVRGSMWIYRGMARKARILEVRPDRACIGPIYCSILARGLHLRWQYRIVARMIVVKKVATLYLALRLSDQPAARPRLSGCKPRCTPIMCVYFQLIE